MIRNFILITFRNFIRHRYFTIINLSGLALGLIVFMAEQRIALRKVLAISVLSMYGLIFKDFLVWAAIAFVVSTPMGWYVMDNWPGNFACRTNISPSVFLLYGMEDTNETK